MEKVLLGIDLGTTNTVCCRFNNTMEFVKFRGKELLPSAICYRNEKVIVGDVAKKRATVYPENVVMSSKTYIGDDEKVWEIVDEKFTPTDVAKYILQEVYKEAQKTFNVEKCAAVITVPAYFLAKQYRETEKAAEEAGFEVIQILPEPVAAAIAYGMDEEESQDIFVIDLGGGTFDVSILKINENKFDTINFDGDRKLGGDDFDNILVDMCMKRIRKENGINLSSFEKSGLKDQTLYAQIIQKLKFESEKAKIELSILDSTNIVIPSLIPQENNSINFQMEISRHEFEKACQELLNKIEDIIVRCLDDAEMLASSIDKVILVGGSSNIPFVQQLIKDVFGCDPYSDKDLSKLVAVGAAVVATGDKTLIKDKKLDITYKLSHSLGIAVADEKFSIILPKNTKYPCRQTESYTTTYDYQEVVSIEIYEGEDENNIKNNSFYDKYKLEGIEIDKKGIPNIEVTFSFDKNRVLHVNAMDSKTKASKSKEVKIK